MTDGEIWQAVQDVIALLRKATPDPHDAMTVLLSTVAEFYRAAVKDDPDSRAGRDRLEAWLRMMLVAAENHELAKPKSKH
jgi:hypothetical protein